MSLPSLLSTLPRSAQVQIAVLGPLLLGALSGFLLDASVVGYWALQIAGAAGGVSGGMEHSGPAVGARRGLAAGALFGAGLVGAHAISDQPTLAYLPHPLVLIVLANAAIGAALGGVGGVARRRWERQATELEQGQEPSRTPAQYLLGHATASSGDGENESQMIRETGFEPAIARPPDGLTRARWVRLACCCWGCAALSWVILRSK